MIPQDLVDKYTHNPMIPQDLLQQLQPSNPTQKLTTGCPVIDACLGGGIPCNSITELVAESGSGKTQLSLQLLLTAQFPASLNGLSASSLYLHSEFPFPFRRLRQLSLYFPHPQSSHHNPLDHIFVHPLHSADDLLDVLLRLDPILSTPTNSRFPIKLVVIDSIAALFRSEFDNSPSDLKRRSSMFFKITAKLKSQAKRFGIAVVITNQVVDFIGSGDGLNGLRVGNLSCLYSSGRRVCPALGLAWANCINSRLFVSLNDVMERKEDTSVEAGCSGFVSRGRKRQLHIVFAPHLPYSSCEFVITKEGVFGVAR